MKIKAGSSSALRCGVPARGLKGPRKLAFNTLFNRLFSCKTVSIKPVSLSLLLFLLCGPTTFTPALAQEILTFDQILKENLNPINGLGGANQVVISPDGRTVYVAGNSDDAIGVFLVDSLSHTLRFVEAKKDNLAGVDGLNGVHTLAISADGRYLYATGDTDDALVVFSRNTATGAIEIVDIERNGFAGVTGLNEAEGLVLSPDGKHVYAAGQQENTLAAFSRDSTSGELGFLAKYTDNQNGLDGLGGATALAISPDGRQIYAAATGEAKVSVFSRDDTTGVLTFIEVHTDNVGGVTGLGGVTAIALSPDGTTVYTVSNDDDAIVVFSRDLNTGALTFVEMQEDGTGGVNGLSGASFALVSGDGHHVYVSGPFDAALAIFSRDSVTGALTFVDAIVDGLNGVEGLSGVAGLALNPAGDNLYVAGAFDASVSIFARNSISGELTYTSSRFDGEGDADGLSDIQSVAVSPDGRHVYAANGFGDEVSVFRRDELAGKVLFVQLLSDNIDGVDGLSEASGVTISADGKFVYVVSHTDDAVAVFSRDAITGELTFVEAKFDGLAGVNGLNGASFVAISPDTANLYVASSDEDAVAVFARNKTTGKLTFVEVKQTGSSGITTLDGARSLAISPDGKQVYVVSINDDALTAFARDLATGRLTLIEAYTDGQSGVNGLSTPLSVAVSPDGKHVYAVGEFDNALMVFSRDAATGKLTVVETLIDGQNGVDGLSFPLAVALSPDGQFVYASATGDDAVSVFLRNQITGRLTYLESQKDGRGPVDGLGFPQGLTPSQDGNYLYIAGDFDGMAVFTVNDVAPTKPKTFSATAGEKHVSFQWSPNIEQDIKAYRLYRHTVRDSLSASLIRTVIHPDTSITDSTVSNNITYYYWLSAVDSASHESVLTAAVPAFPVDAKPSRPLQLSASGSFRRVDLVWTGITEGDLASYIVYRETLSSFAPTRQDSIATVLRPDTTYTDTTVVNGTTYYYKIAAVDSSGGESLVSPEASAQPTGPTAVTLANALAKDSYGVVRIAWTVASSHQHAGFHILRGTSPGGPFQQITGSLIQPNDGADYVFEDKQVHANGVYHYQLQAVATDGNTEIVHTFTVTVKPPNAFDLAQNYPNPFNPDTLIRYALADAAHVRVVIYNAAGQVVRTLVDADQTLGFYTIRWDSRNDQFERVASGIYLYRIEAGGFSQVRKMTLVK